MHRYIALADCHLDIVALLSAHGTIVGVSAAIQSLGYTLTEVVGRRLTEFLHPADHDAAIGGLAAALESGAVGRMTLRYGTKEGFWRTLEVRLTNRLEEPTVRSVIMLSRDVTDLRSAESRIAELTAEIASVEGIRRAAVQRERRRIARDLHDDLGHLLFRQKLSLEMARSSATHELATQHVITALAVLERVFVGLRGVTTSMTNSDFASGGFSKALAQLSDGLRSVTETSIHLDVDEKIDSIHPDVALNSFWIVQEAVNNVIHHAKATNLWVTVARGTDHLAVSVVDDGCGFDVLAESRKSGEGRHSGIRNMRERAALLQGHIHVVSPVGTHGTRISLSIPL